MQTLLLFLRTLISPIEFEEKISIGQTIDEKQKKLNIEIQVKAKLLFFYFSVDKFGEDD